MAPYTILIENASIVRPLRIVRAVIAGAFEALVSQAGHELNLVTAPRLLGPRGPQPDVSLGFDGTRRPLGHHFFGPGILGEQSGAIAIGAILELRAGGPVHRSRLDMPDHRRPLRRTPLPANTTHADTTRPLFHNGEEAFARAVGNVCVHELGHTIGNLSHLRDPGNYMFTGASINSVFGPGWRTYENLRRHWSGRFSFNGDQRRLLVGALENRDLLGVGRTAGQPAASSPP